MPIGPLRNPTFKPDKPNIVTWNTWRKGLNTLLRETEIDGAELTQATNLLLLGSGVPSKRWGSQNYFLAGATGYGRALLPIKDANENIQVLAMTDWGVLIQKNNASYTPITGSSWGSGYNLEGAELGGNIYLVNGQQPLVRYDFTSLTNFPTIAAPTGISVSNLSGATGLSVYSWRVTSVTKVGETIGSTAVSFASLPQQLATTSMRVQWTPTSAASGDLVAYNIYRGFPGSETFVGGVGPTTTVFTDMGSVPDNPFRTSPIVDTTGGPIAKYIMRFQDRLILAGIPGSPTKVLISARYPQQERFDWYAGGGFVLIEPDSGEDVMGLGTYYVGTTQTVIVFKERSVWELQLPIITFANTAILNPVYRLLTASQGCSSHRSIAPVENDIMFANRKGIYMLRYEPQLIQVINANEISAKIRPFFENLSNADLLAASAVYINKKYLVSYPSVRKTIMFDRERLCFMGPWSTTFGINKWATYIDASGVERWLAMDSDDGYVSEFRSTYVDDKGIPFNTLFKSKKEDFGDWTIFKTVNEIFTLFRNVQGTVSVNIYLEQRNGATITAKSFSVTGATAVTGFGTELFGLTEFGMSDQSAQFSSTETPKRTFVYKTARTFQIEIITSGNSDNYELLGIKTIAIPQSRGNAPSSWTT